MQELRDDIHRAIRAGDALKVRELLEVNGEGAKLLALGKNTTGRCSLHIAVLHEHEDIVRYIAKTHPKTLRVGDNVSNFAAVFKFVTRTIGLHIQMELIIIKFVKIGFDSWKGPPCIMQWEYLQWKT